MVWDSTTMQARMSPARIESILTAVKRVREGRSLTVKQYQRLLGLMTAASNVISFGLLYMRPLQWWLKTKGFSLRGNPLRIQGHVAMPTCLRHVEETLVLVLRPGAGSSLSLRNASEGRIPHRWRAVMSGHTSQYGSRHPVEAGAQAQGNGGFTQRWWSRYGEFLARLRWIYLRLRWHRTVPSGSLWLI